MQQWIPVSTSPKGRLVRAALEEFGSRSFENVSVGELATKASVTTGALYHHFQNKFGLYDFVRTDVEKRLLDRMEGAAAGASADPLDAALLVGFDFAVRQSFARLLSESPPNLEDDQLVDLLARVSHPLPAPIGQVLASAWRAAVSFVADGGSVIHARQAILAISPRPNRL